MRNLLYWLAIPAVVMVIVSRLGATPRLPRFLVPFFRWFSWVGHITLAVYCVIVAVYALLGLRYTDRTELEIWGQIVVAIVMLVLAGSFWRTAKRTS